MGMKVISKVKSLRLQFMLNAWLHVRVINFHIIIIIIISH